MRRGMIMLGVMVVVAALAGAGAAAFAGGGGSTVSRTVTVRDAAPAALRTTTAKTVAAIYRSAASGIVEVRATSTSTGGTFWTPGQAGTETAQGTGFEIDRSGDIVTNAHVVSGASSVTVTTRDGARQRATVVGVDESTDIAVIRIHAGASSLHPLALGTSAGVAVGDPVVAIGDQFGLDDTVTTGIVSALGRTITSPNGRAIHGAIQTDAAINHGSSGGPLLDDTGQVIGVTSQISTGGSGSGNVGIGFAVPSDTVRLVASRILR